VGLISPQQESGPTNFSPHITPYRPTFPTHLEPKHNIPTSTSTAPSETLLTHTWIHNSTSSSVRCGHCADYFNNIVLCTTCPIRVCEDCKQVQNKPQDNYCENFHNAYNSKPIKEKTPVPIKPYTISPLPLAPSAAHIDEGVWEISGPIWDHDSSPPPMFQQFNLTNHRPPFIDDPYFGRMDLDPDPWPEDPYDFNGCSDDEFNEDPNYW